MELADLFRKKDIDPARVLVLRHTAPRPELQKRLPWFAAEMPEVFNAYQQTQQGEVTEKAFTKVDYVASFIGHQAGAAVFVGLYKIGASRPMSREEYWTVPAYVEMKKFGMDGFGDDTGRESLLWFDLALDGDFYGDWKGKLVVEWPGREVSIWRQKQLSSSIGSRRKHPRPSVAGLAGVGVQLG